MSTGVTFAEHFAALLALGHLAIAGATALHVLLFKLDSRAAFGWLGLVILFPLAGFALYVVFGINRVHRKAQHSPGLALWAEHGALPETPEPVPDMPMLERVGWRVTGQHVVGGNGVVPLVNGEQAFPQMLDAIRGASREVLLSTFIFDNDHTGETFVAACDHAGRRGVTVKVLIDDVGRRYSMPSILKRLRRAELEYRTFMPLRLFPPSLSVNLRNHRKLLIVDDRVAFAGGMNIGDRQLVASGSRRRATDLHFRFEGPVVHALRHVFEDDWRNMGGAALAPPPASPAPAPAGHPCRCRVVPDGPDERLDHLAMLIEGVVSAARERVWALTPYFLPHRTLMGALQSAALRGVDVAVVIPAHNNWPFVRWALGHNLWELQRAGIRVYEQPPPFAHAKALVVDDDYVLVGSTNLDPRSLRLNFELGVEVFSRELNAALAEHLRSTLERATLISRERTAGRGVALRVRDAVAALFSPYL